MRTFTNFTEDDFTAPHSSNRGFFTPRGSLFNKSGTLNSTNHLEKFKLTTIKSKLK